MDDTHARPRIRRGAYSKNVAGSSDFERTSFLLLLIFPIMGTFWSPESYFAAQEFSVASAAVERVWPIPVAKIVTLSLMLWLIYFMIRNIRLTAWSTLNSAILIAFGTWIVISSLWSSDVSASFNRGVRGLLAITAALYFISTYSHQIMVRTMIIAGITAMVLSIGAVVLLPAYGMSTLTGYENAWRGAFPHKNTLGLVASNLVIISVYALISKATAKSLAWWGLLLGLFLLAMSRSATSALATVTCSITMLVATGIVRSRVINDKMLLMLAGALIIGLAVILNDHADEVLKLVGRSATLTGRTEVWEVSYSLIERAPFLGLGNSFWQIDSPLRTSAWQLMGWAAPHAHSTLIDLRLQTGVVGLALGVFTCALCILRLLSLMLRTNAIELVLWCGLLLNIFIRASVETSFVEPGSGAFFYFTLAFAGLARLRGRVLTMRRSQALDERKLRPRYPASSDAEPSER